MALRSCVHNDLDVREYSARATGSIERRDDDHRYAFTHVFITASTNADIENDWRILE